MEEIAPSGDSAFKRAIADAIRVFVHGFAFTRSLTHPYLAERVGPLWALRDAPRPRDDYRNEEWVAHGVEPAEIDRVVRAHTRGRFAICLICAVDEPQAPASAGFKALGYRLLRTEPLMIHRLAQIPHFDAPAVIERVTTVEMAKQLAKAARMRPMASAHLTSDSTLRQYVARVDDQVVGWVASIAVADATWCSNMYVRPDVRRRGIARAMLCRMLQDDLAAGAQQAVLLASHTGAKLYPVVGYEQIGTLLLFTPRRP